MTPTDPLVMRFVNMLINPWMMFQAMDPVYTEICTHQEHDRTRHKKWPPIFIHPVVQFRFPSDLGDEPREHEEIDPRCGDHARFDLQTDLILDITWMMLESTIEKEVVGQGADDVIQDERSDQRNGKARYRLSNYGVAREEGYGLDIWMIRRG